MPELEPGEEARDYYRLLGVAETASDEEIQRRYHALAMQWHPDRFLDKPEPERMHAEGHMKLLNRAYRVLSDPELRQQYDERRKSGVLFTHHETLAYEPVTPIHVRSSVPPGVAPPAPFPGGRDVQGSGSFGLAMVCFIIALSFLWLLLREQFALITGSLLLLGMLLFSLGGVLFLQERNILTHWVNDWLSSEPKRFRQQHTHAEHLNISAKETIAHNQLTPFEHLVEEALAAIPDEFQEQMGNLLVLVEPEPDEETMERVGTKEGHILLGLYQGIPLTKQGFYAAGQPERITIYQKNIEAYCHGDPDLIRNQVRQTVLHEVAHHFGMDHDEMPIWVK